MASLVARRGNLSTTTTRLRTCQVFAHHLMVPLRFQGSLVASNRDRSEGFSLGVKKGFEIGSEIGFFESFAKVWLKLVEADSDKKVEKVRKELKKLQDLAEKVSDQVRDWHLNSLKLELPCPSMVG